ncbi:PilN domain-containing protein, partial [Dactylosporangium sp. NPDC049525]|uniref:PilN domain-containing protein n=1 Tax=Dactylosporangium sp. NPDC049525 TaxID=3154730 RepID=UPI00343C58DF
AGAPHPAPPHPSAPHPASPHPSPPHPSPPHPSPPHPSPPHPTPLAPGVPEASVPPPPRPAPPSIPPAGHLMQAATMPAAMPATVPPIAQPGAGQSATMPPARATGAPSDAVTAVQPAVPAVVHAAQQSVSSAPHESGGPDGQAPPVPAKKGRDGAPHPAFPDATARTMRILPIAADLLPLEITELRRLRMVRRLVIAGVAAFMALLFAWYVAADGKTDQAQTELNAVQDSRRDLNRKKATYTELEQIRQQRKNITAQLGILMELDLPWSALLTSLQKAAPKGVALKSVTGALDAAEASPGAGGDVIGTITLTGTAPTKKDVAAYVDTLGGVTGLANPFPSDANETDEGLNFTIRVDVTKASLGGRFTSPSAAPSASGGN